MKRSAYILYLLTCVLILASCETNDPPLPDNGNGNGEDKPKPNITLTFDDNSSTEIWLKVDVENIQLPDTFLLRRNGVAVNRYEITKSGMEVYLDSLPPSQSYTYTAIINDTVTSEVTALTMDTTSHNFSYEVFEFGEHGNSVLRDIAIIDENNIWAVGAVYLNDSTGQRDTDVYNAVHWNGIEWEIKRVTVDFRGNLITIDMEGIYAISSTDIWMVGSLPVHGDGESWEMYDVRNSTNSDLSLSKAWGTSSNDMYFVGRGGSIAHYNGTTWSKLESGTSMTLADVYGTNSNDVYLSGVNSSTISGILLQGNSSGFTTLKNSSNINPSQLFEELFGELASVWVDEKGTLYVGGNLLYWNRRGSWDYVRSLPENILDGIPPTNYRGFISSIRGNASNDYVIAGERNTIKHFNGISWQQIGMEYDPGSPIDWYSVEQKGNTIVAVGAKNYNAIIIKLQR